MGSWVRNNFWLFFFGIFASVATIMGLVAAVVWLNTSRIIRNGVAVEGRVVELSYHQGSARPIVEYETQWGETRRYVGTTSSSPPAYRVGESVKLWYDPQDPDEVTMSGLERWFLPLIFGLFFVIFGAIGYSGLLGQWLRRRQKKWLIENGRVVQTALLEVGRKATVRMNGVSPFVFRTQWVDPADNKVYTYESDFLWFDPENFLANRKIEVLIDPRNPKIYHIDLSFLPQPGN